MIDNKPWERGRFKNGKVSLFTAVFSDDEGPITAEEVNAMVDEIKRLQAIEAKWLALHRPGIREMQMLQDKFKDNSQR